MTWEPPEEPKPGKAYWLLSLFAPSTTDSVDWSRGNYSLVERSGRVHSASALGGVKQVSQMVEEGSVLIAGEVPVGSAQDVAPEGCPHPVYRTGFAVSLEIPWRVQA
jgi:CRISPR/Cas system CSM-associated protein Csm4 (group 5 of RAMP superfamily)